MGFKNVSQPTSIAGGHHSPFISGPTGLAARSASCHPAALNFWILVGNDDFWRRNSPKRGYSFAGSLFGIFGLAEFICKIQRFKKHSNIPDCCKHRDTFQISLVSLRNFPVSRHQTPGECHRALIFSWIHQDPLDDPSCHFQPHNARRQNPMSKVQKKISIDNY